MRTDTRLILLRLLAVNGISLALALIANLALLLNMARRISFAIALPITIIGFYLASFLLIAIVAVASHQLRLPSPPDHALSQAFYYAIIAAALYFIISSLLLGTVYGAVKGHYSYGFKLTMSQRTLMMQTISFMIYLLAGAAVWAHIEQWTFLDAVYWADFTLLTIGIGDFAPTTHLGRGLLFPYAIGGIIMLGLVIGSIRSLALERGKRKLGARIIERQRRKIVKELANDNNTLNLTPLSDGQRLTSLGRTERQRREEEFKLMRQIQEKGEQRRRWTALGVSLTAWLILWLVGAVAFWQADHDQSWTYFQSLYFAYTSLLTIGYGDFRPMSNSSKPFFVFWSLLAVPTLTILISNMGDTIVKGMRDFTLVVGELTVLPGDAGFRPHMKAAVRAATNGKVFADLPDAEKSAGQSRNEDDDKSPTKKPGGKNGAKDVADAYGKQELDIADEARMKGDKIRENIHYYHYLLVREIMRVMKDLNSSPPRQYTYDEWAWFLKLIGEDESSGTFHRRPRVKGNQDLGQGQTKNEDGEVRQWSWLGNRSPLMDEKDEAAWILERLAATLERELKQNRDKAEDKGEDKPDRGIPVSRGSHTSNEGADDRSDDTEDKHD